MMRKKTRVIEYKAEELKRQLMSDAKAIGMPTGGAEPIVEKVVAKVSDWVRRRPAITEMDLNRKVAEETAKYNKDLAYVYQNRGKII